MTTSAAPALSSPGFPVPSSVEARITDWALGSLPVSDAFLRASIRFLLARRLRGERQRWSEPGYGEAFHDRLESGDLAVRTADANRQHYEVETAFYQAVLGRHMKYSSGYWPDGVTTLDDAEAAMLDLTIERAEIADHQRILELGCGWGSLTLRMAERFPSSSITALTNSATQKAHVEATAAARGIRNVTVVRCDINAFEPAGRFNRVVSVEMFEHVRNHRRLFERIARWLEDDGRLFVHVFAHREFAYLFEDEGGDDWMSRHFFSGGIMPSREYLLRFQESLVAERTWTVDGTHYARTAEEWLRNMDRNRSAVDDALARTYGADEVSRWRRYWRIFFLSCAELWGYGGGMEWTVEHYRFRKPTR